jgi:hypothetical protein
LQIGRLRWRRFVRLGFWRWIHEREWRNLFCRSQEPA